MLDERPAPEHAVPARHLADRTIHADDERFVNGRGPVPPVTVAS